MTLHMTLHSSLFSLATQRCYTPQLSIQASQAIELTEEAGLLSSFTASMQKFVYFRRRRTLKHIGSRLEVTRGFASTGKASRCMGTFTALTNVLCMRSMFEGTSNAKSKKSPDLLFQRRLF